MKKSDEAILNEAIALAEYVYGLLDEFSEDEKWQTSNKLRTCANDLMFFTAQAVGNKTPNGAEYEWGSAKKSITALKTMYRFATKQKFIELEPEIIVRISAFIKNIDSELGKAHKLAEDNNKKDMKDWLKRYKIWSQTKL